MGLSKLHIMKCRGRAALRAAAFALAAIVAVQFFGGLTSPAHALIPIMHNSSTTQSTYWGGGWGNTTNSKYGQFVCTTCHTAGLAGGNAKQVKQTIVSPNPAKGTFPGSTVVFTSYTTYGADNAHATSTRVCEVCHTQTTHHRYNNPGQNHMGSVDCFTCHSHSNGFKKPSCTSCHGNPPTAAALANNGVDGNTGMVNPVTNGTTALNPGAHAVHNSRYPNKCEVCHNGNTMPTVSSTIQMGFYGFNGRVTSGTFTGYTTLNGQTFVSSSAGTTVVRRNAATNPTCSNLNCHGGGGSGATSALTGGTNIAPLWTGGSGEAACGTCHGATMANPPTLGSHTKHVSSATGYSFDCTKCHRKVTDGSHVRGNVFIRMSSGTTLLPNGSAYNGFASYSTNGVATKNAYKSCTNLYCHSDGITNGTPIVVPTWGNTLDCKGCHSGSLVSGASNIMASNKHGQHVNPGANSSLGLGNGLGCVQCHAKTVTDDTTLTASKVNHVNTLKDYSGARARGSANYNTGTKLCSNLYCHSNGNPGFIQYKNPTAWNAGSVQSCNMCHGNETSPDFANTIGAPNYVSGGAVPSTTANSHKKHTVDIGGASVSTKICANCHVKTVSQAVNSTFKDYTAASYHLNGSPNLYFKTLDGKASAAWNGGAGTCSATYCHGTAVASATWGQPTSLACNSCHSANAATTGTQHNWAGPPAQSAHKLHIENSAALPTKYINYSGNVSSASQYRFTCSVCHSPNAGALHADGPALTGVRAAQVFFGYTTGGVAGGTYTPGGSATNNDNGFNWTTASCATVYCHSNGNSGPGLATVFWNTTSATKNNGNCVKCHGNNATSGAPITTGKHANHINPATGALLNTGNGLGCVQCHAKTVSDDKTISNKAKHVNRFKDYSGAKAGGSARYNTTYAKSCNNIYCHSNGNPGNVVFVAMTGSKTWIGSATMGCNGCHGRSNTLYGAPDYANGAAPNLNSHSKHITALGINNTIGCAKCHAKTVDATFPSKYRAYSTMHLNGNPNVYIKAGYYGGGSDGTNNFSANTCSNITCHSNNGGTYQSVSWGTASNCSMCHPMNSLTGAHRFHVYTSAAAPTVYSNMTANRSNGASAPGRYNFGCSICHPTAAPGSHGNGSGQVLLDLKPAASGGSLKNKNSATITNGGYVAGYVSSGTFGTPGTSVKCFGVYCHSNGGNGGAVAFQAYTSPDWYGSFTASTDKCAMCHGNWPNSARATDNKVMVGSAAHYNSNWLGTGAAGGHAMGIHAKKIAKGANFIGLLTPGSSEPASHGVAGSSTTISCNICHNATVTAATNNGSALCSGCHAGAGNANATIAFKNKHVNGTVDVVFQGATIYSKAQMRDAAFSLNSSSTNNMWHRNNGFKANTSYDSSKQVLSDVAYVPGNNCTNICHFKQPLKWSNTPGTIDCYSCHKNM